MKIDLTVRAELIKDDIASALDITVRSFSPVLALCRKLIEAGHHPNTPIAVYRGEMLCLGIRSIGETAQLEINGDGTGFRPRSKPGRAALVHPNA